MPVDRVIAFRVSAGNQKRHPAGEADCDTHELAGRDRYEDRGYDAGQERFSSEADGTETDRFHPRMTAFSGSVLAARWISPSFLLGGAHWVLPTIPMTMASTLWSGGNSGTP